MGAGRSAGAGCRGQARPRLLVYGRRAPWFWEITGFHTHVIPGTGALFVMEHMPGDHALKVTGGGTGLIGHAGAVLLRKAADQAGLTAGLARMPGHAAAPRERRIEHLHRSPGCAGRRGPAGARPIRRKILVRVDGAGASHELVKHLLGMSSPRRETLFTCGWMITDSDEAAIAQVPADACKPGIGQDGTLEEDKAVAEITGLMSRAGNWPEGLRWIARRVKPSRRQMRNLTAYEKKTGWRYSITCTNIPGP